MVAAVINIDFVKILFKNNNLFIYDIVYVTYIK